MLRLHPDRRAKASDLIHHNLLDGIVVQGEIDVIRRMEQEEAEKRKLRDDNLSEGVTSAEQRGSNSRAASREKSVAALDQSERDAMKPVEGSSLIVEDGEAAFKDETRTTAQQYHHYPHEHRQNQPPLLHSAPQQRAPQHKKHPSLGKQDSTMLS
jgi:serine/threonine-protein kinase SRPK3